MTGRAQGGQKDPYVQPKAAELRAILKMSEAYRGGNSPGLWHTYHRLNSFTFFQWTLFKLSNSL